MKKSSVYYSQIIDCNRQIAMLSGYDSYPKYADEKVYYRDYGTIDVQNFTRYTKEYLVSLGEELYQRTVYGSNRFAVSDQVDLLIRYDCSLPLVEVQLSGYLLKMGKEFENAFDRFKDHLYTCKNKSSAQMAFTAFLNGPKTPVCYIGENYQNLSTYLHELGHFNAYYMQEQTIPYIDLCEAQSQTNELLYLAYVSEQYNTDLYNGIRDYYVLNQVVTGLLAVSCDLFERTIYEDASIAVEDYDDVYIDCIKKLGAYDLLYAYMGNDLQFYWRYAVIGNSMYYFSYAVSALVAIDLYVTAMEMSFDLACEKYYKLCNSDSRFKKTVNTLNIGSPFAKKTYERLLKHFSVS